MRPPALGRAGAFPCYFVTAATAGDVEDLADQLVEVLAGIPPARASRSGSNRLQ